MCVLVSIINFVFFNYKFILIEKIISVLARLFDLYVWRIYPLVEYAFLFFYYF
jgi:hypothetical protein